MQSATRSLSSPLHSSRTSDYYLRLLSECASLAVFTWATCPCRWVCHCRGVCTRAESREVAETGVGRAAFAGSSVHDAKDDKKWVFRIPILADFGGQVGPPFNPVLRMCSC
jgi:hypothetical protein